MEHNATPVEGLGACDARAPHWDAQRRRSVPMAHLFHDVDDRCIYCDRTIAMIRERRGN